MKARYFCAIGVLAISCASLTTGNEGNLDFIYGADDQVLNFNKPIAVGAKLDMGVRETGNLKLVQLTDAKSQNDAVLQVVNFSGSSLTLQGTGSGGALIEVKAKLASGTSTSDSINMMARIPEVLKMSRTCLDAGKTEALYFVNQDFVLPFEMEMKNGQSVIGYGYHPISVSPADGLSLDKTTKDQQFFHFRSSGKRQTVTLSSTIDKTVASVVFVDPSDVDGAELKTVSPKVFVGATAPVQVLPLVAQKRVCQPVTEMAAVSLTPTVCEVATINEVIKPEDLGKDKFGLISIAGKAVGKCSFKITYPKARSGQGYSTSFEVDVLASP